MPQMAPLNWLILFMFFSFMFLTFNVMNFYSFSYEPMEMTKTTKKTIFNWKW